MWDATATRGKNKRLGRRNKRPCVFPKSRQSAALPAFTHTQAWNACASRSLSRPASSPSPVLPPHCHLSPCLCFAAVSLSTPPPLLWHTDTKHRPQLASLSLATVPKSRLSRSRKASSTSSVRGQSRATPSLSSKTPPRPFDAPGRSSNISSWSSVHTKKARRIS